MSRPLLLLLLHGALVLGGAAFLAQAAPAQEELDRHLDELHRKHGQVMAEAHEREAVAEEHFREAEAHHHEAEELERIGHEHLREMEELHRHAQEVEREIAHVHEEMERAHARHRQEREHGEGGEVERLLHGLEMGMEALAHLGDEEAVHRLERHARALRERLHAGREHREHVEEHPEAAAARRQLHVMRYGVEALLEAGMRDRAEVLEHALHARELALEGRDGGEAMHVRETAPPAGHQIELMQTAARLYREWGRAERAHACFELAESMAERMRHARRSERETDREHPEIRAARRQLRGLELAWAALDEAGWEGAAARMEVAVRRLEAAIDGRREEAAALSRKAPSRAELVRMLRRAHGFYQEWEMPEEARAVAEVARQWSEQLERRRRSDTALLAEEERIRSEEAELEAEIAELEAEARLERSLAELESEIEAGDRVEFLEAGLEIEEPVAPPESVEDELRAAVHATRLELELAELQARLAAFEARLAEVRARREVMQRNRKD